VRYELTERFKADLARLSQTERELFATVVRNAFIPACERKLADPAVAWPASLRVRVVVNAPGIWEMTWSFAGPDGRATFEWIRIAGQPGIRWRRIGGHAIFGEP
jgi:hypothetical protein